MTVRRDFLAFTAGAVVARTVLPLAARAEVPNPDAALLQATADYMAVENGRLVELARVETWKLSTAENAAVEAEQAAEIAKQDALLLTLATVPASTVAGAEAKARVLLSMMGRNPSPLALGYVGTDDLVRSILRDLVPGAGA